MALKLYNTWDRRISEFKPLVEGKASLYCCGPTVYNYAHIGNLRTYLFEDLLRRTLSYSGFEVRHVLNVTDVGHLTGDGDDGEDKMVRAAREQGLGVWEIARFFTEAFFKDADRLRIQRPEIICRATEHIEDMIALIQRLESLGFTYVAGGNVYFDTARFPGYGRLALLDQQELQAGARVEIDPHKKNPRDFVLWFTRSKFEDQAMTWDSPWGRGYPGWHIECSAMSMKYLGERFDIHCGGVDHVPVHHTNEIAQSEAAIGGRWVNYWVHGEFLLMAKEKMSKSSGEFLTLDALCEKGYDPLDYRYFCLGGHYRTQLSFSFESLDAARSARKTLFEKTLQLKALAEPSPLGEPAEAWREGFRESLFNDLNTPQILAHLWGLLKNPTLAAGEKLTLLYEMDQVLGLGLVDLEPAGEDIPEEILALADQRRIARQEKNFSRSDEIRALLKAAGWAIEDTPQGSVVKKI